MKIGIIGHLGIVGGAVSFGLSKIGHRVIGYDIRDKSTNIDSILDTQICFVAVPTPLDTNGLLNVNAVTDVVSKLSNIRYNGIVAIKSTLNPGNTATLSSTYRDLIICHNPEFLKERTAIADFVENHKLLVVGTWEYEHISDRTPIYETIVEVHGKLPKKSVHLTSTQSELLKLFHNAAAGLRISFANECYDIASAMKQDWYDIKSALLDTTGLPDVYFDVNPNTARGYGSICLDKDIPALVQIGETLGVDLKLLPSIIETNNKYPVTAFGNTRVPNKKNI